MSCFIALSDIETQISSLFNGNHFHYGCAALRVAIDIETPILFLYRSAALSFTIVHYRSLSQRSAAVVEILF